MRRAVARENPVTFAASDNVIAGRCLSNAPSRARPLASVAMNSLSCGLSSASCSMSGSVYCAIAPANFSELIAQTRRGLTAIRRLLTIIQSANLRSIIEHKALCDPAQGGGVRRETAKPDAGQQDRSQGR